MQEVFLPADAAELRDGRIRLAALLSLAFPGAVPSNKEGRRKIEQGAVRLDGEVVDRSRPRGHRRRTSTARSLQMGKRNWARLRA